MASLSKPSRRADVRRSRYAGLNTVSMKVDMGPVNQMVADLKSDVLKATRPASQAVADVLYHAVLKNVEAIGSVSGNLRSSIYQVFSADKSQPAGDGYARATYHVSWNAKVAPHGHLVEYGHIQRYAVRTGKDGRWYTLVRPEMRGTPKPRRGASQAQKDAYYVLRPGGPVQVAAKPFIRPAYHHQAEAIEVAKAKFHDLLGAK